MTGGRPLLAIVVSHPIQYQAHLWRALAQDGRVSPHVLFLSRHGLEPRFDPAYGLKLAWDVDLLSGYDSEFLPNLREQAAPGGLVGTLNPTIFGALRRLRPDAVLFVGLRNLTSLAGFAFARRQGIPSLYWSDSSVLQAHSGLAGHAAAWVLARVDGVLSIGTANDLYYAAMGVGEERRFWAPHSVDNAFIRKLACGRTQARAELGLDEREFVLLYVGALKPAKDPLLAVEAIAGAAHRRVRLLVAGDGVLRDDLLRLARARRVQLTLLNFVNQTRLPRVYAAADALVLPSLAEPWGMVLNEAMNVSLPLLVSSRVGAHLDLVRRGENGEVFRAGAAAELARMIERLSGDEALRSAWGAQSRRIVDRFDASVTVQGIVEALHATSATRQAHACASC